MSPEDHAKAECLSQLTQAGLSYDIEEAHSDADQAVMAFLHSIGHGDIADLWGSIEKWYV